MAQQQPPSLPPQLPTAGTGAVGGVQVRCAGCHKILTIAAGVTEFVCGTCQLPQMLPPELMTRAQAHNSQPNKGPLPQPPPRPQHVAAHGVDPTKIQLPCANCKAILNVPHGLSRFQCPQCHVDLAVDVSKLKEFLLPPPPEEVNEVNSFTQLFVLLRICGNVEFEISTSIATSNTLLGIHCAVRSSYSFRIMFQILVMSSDVLQDQ